MKDFELMNRKEIKKINELLKKQFDNEFDFSPYLAYKTGKDRVYLVNNEASKLDLDKLRVNNLGLYFLTIENTGVRLSIDGSQLFKAKKNILELDRKQFEFWMVGIDLPAKVNKGYYILNEYMFIFYELELQLQY